VLLSLCYTTGDETISLVSDTWSTDVLASDSETVEQSSERNFPTSTTDGAVNQLAETHVSYMKNNQRCGAESSLRS
jgi:hypothetical protein